MTTAAGTDESFRAICERGRRFFDSGKTRDPDFRRAQLRRLLAACKAREAEVEAALKADLNKSPHESYMTEISIVYNEISYLEKHLNAWSRPRRALTALSQMPARVRIHPEPYGLVLVMSPWNYPFQLTLVPIACAIAAGNAVVVKPSAYSPATSLLLRSLVEESLEPGLVQVVLGGRAQNAGLLEQRFDYIFFTGSPLVGHLVMEAAARNLTPLTLELGGKSPVIVDETADLPLACKRLAFGKLGNAGQTCVAPDHIYVHESVKERFLEELKKALSVVTNDPAYFALNFPAIVNEKHFERIQGYLRDQKILFGGKAYPERRQLEPTILDEPSEDSPVMQEEIFGPIFPVLSYRSLDELIEQQRQKEKPLALYLFTRSSENEKKVTGQLSFGGGCINDCLMHMVSPHAPFGGTGKSGMGSYHGRWGFETFSHEKTVLKKPKLFDLPVRYHPFSETKTKLLKRLLR